MNTLVSVIIPVYNVEKYVADCIESIIRQTYTNLEILLVDDGSKDNSGQICDEYAKRDGRIKVIHKENGGVSSARNKGLELAQGDYVTFVDSDDFVSKEYVQALYTNMQEQNADLTFCGFVFSGKKNVSGKEKRPSRMEIDFNSPNTIKYMGRFLRVGSYIMGSSCRVLYKKETIEGLSFQPNIRIGEDLLFVLNAIARAKTVSSIEKDLYFYRVNEESAIQSYKKEYLQNQEDLYEEVQKIFAGYKTKKLLNIYRATLCYECFLNEIKFKQAEKQENIRRIRKSELYRYFTLWNGFKVSAFSRKVKYVIIWGLIKTGLQRLV